MPTFKNKDNLIKIRKMQKNDADAVSQLYRSIAVTGENYKEVLSDSDKSFASHGGMFLISDKEKILNILADSTQKIIVGEYQDKVCGMLWYGKWDENAFPNLCIFPQCTEYGDLIKKTASSSQLAYAEEIISQPPKSAGIMAYALFYTMMSDFSAKGIKNAIGEVYRIDGYTDCEGNHKCDLLNMPSFNLLIRSGGKHIGTSAVKNIEIDNYCVHIKPQIMLWDTAESKNIILDILSLKGWDLISHEEE